MLLDYPYTSYALFFPPILGIERPICNQRRRRFAGKTFMTSDKYLTLRIIGNSAAVKNVTFTMVLVSFHDGKLQPSAC